MEFRPSVIGPGCVLVFVESGEMKVPPRQSKREKTGVSRLAGRIKTDVPRRDSDLDSEHQANLKRDAERAEAERPNCKVERIQTFLV